MRNRLSILFFALATLLINPTSAFAHAGLVFANPAANAEVTIMPEQIQLTFTEELMLIGEKKVNNVSLVGPDGEITISETTVNGALLSATVPAAEYPSGSYTVSYSIVSADGHKLSDSYSFSLNAPTPLIAPAPAGEDEGGDGVLPLPIVGAIAIAVIVGLFVAFGRRNRAK